MFAYHIKEMLPYKMPNIFYYVRTAFPKLVIPKPGNFFFLIKIMRTVHFGKGYIILLSKIKHINVISSRNDINKQTYKLVNGTAKLFISN